MVMCLCISSRSGLHWFTEMPVCTEWNAKILSEPFFLLFETAAYVDTIAIITPIFIDYIRLQINV